MLYTALCAVRYINMNKKTSNYIGLGVGILLTLTILYANDNFKIGSNSKYRDFYTFNIKQTVLYDILKTTSKVFGVRRSSKRRIFSYFLWYVLFTGGFWSSWKYRLKTGKMIIKFSKNIHQKIINE